MVQVVEIVPHGTQEHIYSITSSVTYTDLGSGGNFAF